jgi:two-component system KDP operon response regulator KdpE
MNILIVEDDPSLLEALSISFSLQWEDARVLTALDGEAGLRLFYDEIPDVVLLDVGLPGKSGFDLLREIRRVSDVPVIMLSGHGEEMDEVRGLELGADDYIVKPFGYVALLARIRAVLRRAELPMPIDVAPDFVAGELAVHYQTHHVTLRGERVELTPFEYKLLYQLIRNAGRVLPHETLIDRVWGAPEGAPADYLKVLICRLRAKLGPGYIQTERGVGYRFVKRPKWFEVSPPIGAPLLVAV